MNHITIVHSDRVTALLAGRKVLPPTSYRQPYHVSELVVMDDGSTLPLLWLIAQDKFGSWDLSTQQPYWLHARYYEVDHDTVELSGRRGERKRRTNEFGFKSGTPEYYRAYHAKHRERKNAYQRDRYKLFHTAKTNPFHKHQHQQEQELTTSEEAQQETFRKLKALFEPPPEGEKNEP